MPMQIDKELKKVFVGRRTERDTFKKVLNALITEPTTPRVNVANWMVDEDASRAADNHNLPHIFLISGHGGIGKSELLKRLHASAKRAEEADLCRVADIIQLEAGGTFASRAEVDPQMVVELIAHRLLREGWGEFSAWQAAHAGGISTGNFDNISGNAIVGNDNRLKNMGYGSFEANFYGQSISDEELKRKQREYEQARKQRLTESIADLSADLHRISKQQLLVIVLDTYELVDSVDQQLRPLYLDSGPRVVWMIAGRDSLVTDHEAGQGVAFRGYADTALGGKLHPMPLEELGVADIGEYFAEVGKEKQREMGLDQPQAEAVYRVTRGNALALSMAAQIYLDTGQLENATAPINNDLLRSLSSKAGAQGDEPLVYAMTERLLLYAVGPAARRPLYALAMARRPELGLLAAMMQTDERDFDQRINELAEQYDFVDTRTRTLHDTVAYFLRARLMNEARDGNQQPLIADINQAACDYTLMRIREREAEVAAKLTNGTPLRVELLMKDDKWSELLLDYIHHVLWSDPERGSYEAISAICCAVDYNSSLARRLRDIALALKPCYKDKGWLAVLKSARFWGVVDEPQLNALLDLTTHMGKRTVSWHPDGIAGWGEGRAVLYWRLGQYYNPDTYVGDREKKDRAKVIALYEAGLRESNMVRDLYLSAGYNYGELKRHQEAINAYTRAIALDPNYANAYNNRGSAYSDLKQYQQAIADYTHAIELAPTDAPIFYHNLGITYARWGRFDEALDCYQRSLSERPDHAGTIADFAGYYALKHEPAEALAQLKRAIELDEEQRELAKTDPDFSWLLANDPDFAAQFRALVG